MLVRFTLSLEDQRSDKELKAVDEQFLDAFQLRSRTCFDELLITETRWLYR